MNRSGSRALVAGLSLGLAALLWVGMARNPGQGMVFGLYPMRLFVLLVAISYVAIWIAYVSLSKERLSSSIGKCWPAS